MEGTVDIGIAREYMTADQRFASRRSDVLVYDGARTGGGPLDRRPDQGAPHRLDLRHGFGLDRQID